MAAERKPANFVHLRVKSAYSLLEGAIRPGELAELARDNAMPAVAVTDTNNLHGVFEISETLAKRGVQPIVGCLVSVDLDETPKPAGMASRQKPAQLPLLVQNEQGYRNLSKLLSRAYLGAEPGEWPHVTLAQLAAHSDGLIALTGGPGGPLNALIANGQPEAADELLKRLAAIFPNRLYVELQRHGMPEERAAEDGLIARAYDMDLPLVATNDVHFGSDAMYEAHDALLCIADSTYVSQSDRRKLTREHRFKSAEEMAVQFADLPEAIENTVQIAKRCAFRPKKRAPILPKFEPESGLSPAEELRAQAEAGLTRRLAEHGTFADEQVYRDRLAFELGVIIGMDFPGYFLIVSDFMKWTRAHGIPVGVRGSGATSLVAWSLDITNLDPIRFGLLFERFLN
ncbi:MAG: PHP domain-containing protein, partial [Proteobacteria bacterium]|nr:PHP domain-containing protein [Pseudomonadota bacterium]